MSDSPTKRAEAVQQHGGYKNETLGRAMETFGSTVGTGVGAAIPKSDARTRAASAMFGNVLGKGVEAVGSAIKSGLPVDKPKYDIMKDDFGMSHEDIMTELAKKKG